MQKGMKLFRKQLPIILHESILNDIKGTPIYYVPNNSGDTSDVLMWDKNNAPASEVSQTSKVPKMPINKIELVSQLWNYIMSIDNEDSKK
jgi:hypothetical protein